MQKALAQKISELPQKPGVYMFKDDRGLLLYVGKANKLKNRVSSYFRKDAGYDRRIELMISQIADVDYTVVNNELEALVLENNFIKQLKPKYNVRLRDDKNYIFLKINLKQEIPTIEYERQRTDKSAKYFGPYTSGLALKDTLRLVRRVFPYCANSKVGTKPCFYYHIGKCPGVCIGKISLQDYRENYISKIMQFLEGKQSVILKELQGQMKLLAVHKQFEKAARVRDQIYSLNRVMERQKLVYPAKVNQDVIGLRIEAVASINLFLIREGKLIQKENFMLENTKQASPEQILESFLTRYYLDAANIPKEILVPFIINTEEVGRILTERGFKSKIVVPAKGEKVKLLKLAEENAKQYLEAQGDKHLLEEARLLSSLKELQRVLGMEKLPARMECFDISNIQGTNAVGSMVVFDFAKPKKDAYRKFKINKKSTPDDFAMMREMLERRFKHSLQPTNDNLQTTSWPLPDLIIIDGGKGQLNAALSVLKQYNLQIPIIGLAKRLEEIFVPGSSTPILLQKNSISLFLLQRIRDEAHRFAVTYHRKLRSKSSIKSILDQIPGIGPAKKKILLQQFGSPSSLKSASLTELSNAVGHKLAEKIKASL